MTGAPCDEHAMRDVGGRVRRPADCGAAAPRQRVLFIGKRYYTNRDALLDRYGRIFELPSRWVGMGIAAQLWLVDYHGRVAWHGEVEGLPLFSTPVFGTRFVRALLAQVLAVGKRRRPTHVVASGDCYIGLLGWLLARLCGARFAFDVYDRYDLFQGYRALPGFDPWKFLLARSDRLLFASRVLASDCDPAASRSAIVPNGIDPERFFPRDRDLCRAEFGLDTQTTFVGYAGSLDPDRGIEDLLEAVELLRRDGRDIALLLAGAQRAGLDLQRPWVRYLGNLPPQRVPVALGCCDVLALPYRSTPYLDMASSCKIAEYLACARPIAATRTPNLQSNFPQQASQLEARLAEPGDAQSLARSIDAQLRDPVVVASQPQMNWQCVAAHAAVALGLTPRPDEACPDPAARA
ncbi:MAG: glycosyltransferase [Metallibacterium scheffleri]|jgi:glycosyltransferase involved in cell wall biosynthesis|nr:glycosyltransferase [Metallibacterium scheffleri]